MLRLENITAHFPTAVKNTLLMPLDHIPWTKVNLALVLYFITKVMNSIVLVFKKYNKSNIKAYLLKKIRHKHVDALQEQLMKHAELKNKLNIGINKRVDGILKGKYDQKM